MKSSVPRWFRDQIAIWFFLSICFMLSALIMYKETPKVIIITFLAIIGTGLIQVVEGVVLTLYRSHKQKQQYEDANSGLDSDFGC